MLLLLMVTKINAETSKTIYFFSFLQDHCCILNSIIGWHCVVGEWTRIEGTPTQIDPNAPHATIDNFYLFDEHGRLRPSITILG